MINRTTNPIPLYEVIIPVKGYPNGYKRMNIDGTTGEVIVERMPDGTDRINKPIVEEKEYKKSFWDKLFFD